jgi:polysaccharide pyruvyl transferase WcaK-like protein
VKGDRPRILVHSGWNRYNFGDVAHTPGLLNLLQEHIPEAEVCLWMSRYPEWLRAYIGARFPQVECVQGRLGSAHGPTDLAIEEAYKSADLFIFNSGPIFNHGHELEPGVPPKMQGWRGFDWNATMAPVVKLYYAKAQGVPFGIFAQSFIHIAPPADTVLPEILSQAAFLYTRETDSLRYLEQLGVAAKEMGFAPDAAWAFDLRDDEKVLPWLEKHGLEQGQFLAATTRGAPAGVDADRDRERQIAFFKRVIPAWVETTGLKVVLVPEMAASIQLNREYIYDPLPAAIKERVVLDDALWTPEEEFWTPDQALSVLSRARAYLNVDHHGALIALAAGVPCVHPRQRQAGRKAWIYNDLGLEDWLFEMGPDSADAVQAALLQIHRDGDGARVRAQRAAEIARKTHAERMGFMRGLLGL